MTTWNVTFTNPGRLPLIPMRCYVARREPPVVIVDQPERGFQTPREADAFLAGMRFALQAAARLEAVQQVVQDITIADDEFVVVRWDGSEFQLCRAVPD